MIFQRVTLENFGPYLGRQTLDLTPSDTSSIILIGGMNGGGKTTLMDALRLVLYGQRAQCSTRGSLSYSDFLQQCINRQAPSSEETAVELIFRHSITADPTEYHLRRSWQNQPKPKEILKVFVRNIVDGEPIELPDPTLAKLWDEHIEDILPLGISNLFLFDGEQIKELAEQDIPPPEVVNAIQSLLGLELTDRLALDLKILGDRKQKTLATQQELNDFTDLERQFNEQDDQRKAIKQELAAIQSKLDFARNNAKITLQIFQMRGGEITAQRTRLETEKRQLEQLIEQDHQDLRKLAAQALPLQLITSLLQRAKQQGQLEIQQSQAQLTAQILCDRNQHLLNFAQVQNFPEPHLSQLELFLQKELTNLQKNVQNTATVLNIENETQHHLSSLLDRLLPDQQQRATQLLQRLQQTHLAIDHCDRQLATAAPPEEYASLAQDLETANAKVIDLQAYHQTITLKLQQITDILDRTKAKLTQYGNTIFERQNDEHILRSIDRVQNTLQLFRHQLKNRKIDRLESAVTECFRYLLHKADFIGRVTIDTESFSLCLYDRQSDPIPKHRLSAGEKQLLATAFLWGLARVSGRSLPVAIDTPLGRLDSSHRQNLIERYFPSASHQVLLLSTDTEIAQKEAQQLRETGAIAREYLLDYQDQSHQTTVKIGYFW